MKLLHTAVLGLLATLALTGCGQTLNGDLKVSSGEKLIVTDIDNDPVELFSGPAQMKISKPLFSSARLEIKAINATAKIEFPDWARDQSLENFYIPGMRINQKFNLKGFVQSTTTTSPYQGYESCYIAGCYNQRCEMRRQCYYGNTFEMTTESQGGVKAEYRPGDHHGDHHHGDHGGYHCHYYNYCWQEACVGHQRVAGLLYTTQHTQLIQFLDGDGEAARVQATFSADPTFDTSTNAVPVEPCHY